MKRSRYLGLSIALIVVLAALAAPATGVSAAASMKLSRYNAAPGDLVNVQGFGFSPGDDVVVSVALRVNGQPQTLQAVTQANGSSVFTATLVVPAGTNQDIYTVYARDFHGHVASQTVNVLPLAYLQPGGKTYTVYVVPDSGLYVTGVGFQLGEYVRVVANFPLYNGTTNVFDQTVGTDHGSFYELFVHVPHNAKAGLTSIQATGNTSKKSAKNFIHVVYRPYLLPMSQSVRPGASAQAIGRAFVANSDVRISITIPRSNGATVTVAETVLADGNGNFSAGLALPSDIRLGRYTLTASDTVGGFHASIPVDVSVHPSILLEPTTVLPGQALTVSGENFGSGAFVTVSATFFLRGGGKRTVSAGTRTGARGNYSVNIAIPNSAVPGRVTVTASSSNGQVSTQVLVKARPPLPTATPVPTATRVPPTAVPPTSVPPTAVPTSTQTPHGHHHAFGYRYVSIWYHTVRVGTYDRFVVQASLHTQQGLWINVWFPAGQHLAYYINTDGSGHYEITVQVPVNSIGRTNNHVLVTFRLWHGKSSRRFFSGFTLVR